MTTTTKVTLSLDQGTLAVARAESEREGVTLSAWINRAARREARRDQGRRYQEWLSAHPDVAAEVRAWREWAGGMRAQRWASLAELDEAAEEGQAA